MQKSLYQILGVSENASSEVIDATYRRLHAKYSAGPGAGSEDAANQLAFLRLAYDVLSNPPQRSLYDARLAQGRPTKPNRPSDGGERRPG